MVAKQFFVFGNLHIFLRKPTDALVNTFHKHVLQRMADPEVALTNLNGLRQ